VSQLGPHDGNGATEMHSLHDDERAELERLRAAAARRRRLGWRAPVATVLIVLGCLLAPLAVIGFWAKNEVTNTDRYVENVAPLARDPGVQNLIADRVTDLIFSYVDVKQVVDSAVTALEQRGLPEQVGSRLQGLSSALATGVHSFVRSEVGKVVSSAAFAQAWDYASRAAHGQLVQALSGEGGGAVTVQNGTVSVDLGAFLIVVKQRLSSAGFTVANQIPDVHPTFTLLKSADVTRAQAGYRTLDRLGTALPLIVLALLALGVYINRRHRRALVAAGLGLAVAMLVLAIVLAIGRSVYLHDIPADVLPTSTAASVFDTLVRFIKLGLRTLLVLGLVVAAGAFFTGPATTAVRTRSALSSGLGKLRTAGQRAGLRTGPVGTWVHANRTLLRAGIVGIAAVTFVFWGRPTGKVVILLAVLVLVALAIVEFLATPPRTEPTSA
jgi:hypothetical protein